MSGVSENIFSYITSLYGDSAAKEFSDFIKKDYSLYIRVNRLKSDKVSLIKKLKETYSISTEEISSVPFALKIAGNSESAGKTIQHIIGDYYIQSLSSMIPPLVLSPQPGEKILDLCAAPGSKTTELGEMMNNDGTLIANEIALDRVKMLIYNIDRMNLINAGVVHYKGEWLSKIYSEHFDKVLVDAPCSGLGIVQKKGEVNNWWSKERAERLGDVQLRLLIAAIKMVKTGGEVVYSTCTLTPEENEFIIDKVLKKYPVEIMDIDLPVKSHEGFTKYNDQNLDQSIAKSRRILPWEIDSDGFFIVKLRKIGTTISPEIEIPKVRDIKILDSSSREIRNRLKNVFAEFGISEEVAAKFNFILKNNDIFFLNNNWEDNYPGLFERIGTKFGTIDKNGDIILHTQAAQVLQKEIREKIFEIDNPSDLRKYLDGGIFKTKSNLTGQCVIKYEGAVLGTAVVTGSGIKSRFPRAKRTQNIYLS